MFNIRIKRFYDTEQVQVFSKGFHSKGEVEKNVSFSEYTGEIFERKTGELIENPFTGKNERVHLIQDQEEILKKSCARSVKAIYDIARSNRWEWFLTFTFSPEKVNRHDYDECAKKFSQWLKNMRKKCPDMKYIVVPEKHKDGAFHFHGLFADCEGLDFRDSGKKDAGGKIIYNCHSYRYGFTTATLIEDFRRASSYLCKYITKELCASSFNRKRYWVSKNVSYPEVVELMVELPEEERFLMALEGQTYIKKVETPFTNVTYIEKPIYATNTCSFFANSVSDNIRG